MYGVARMVADLTAMGHPRVEQVVGNDNQPYAVIRGYVIELGRFQGRTIDLGLPAPPDFPRAVGSSVHVRVAPQIFEASDSVANVRNITASALGPEWRYWSHNFGWTDERTTRRLMSQVNRIFFDA